MKLTRDKKEDRGEETMPSRRVTRRETLRMVGAAAAAGAVGMHAWSGRAAPPEQPPDIVFILGDNHNAATMGCAGHPFIKTAGMDRLAREGVLFERAFNTTPLCSPSRASILTGAYAHRHGVKNNHTPWTGRLTTFLEHLSRAGYATAFIGKWHMPGKGLPKMPYLDRFVSYTYREGQGAYFDCPLVVDGKEVSSKKSYITEEMTDYTLDFMRRHAAKGRRTRRPFCVYLSHRPGHPPFQAPEGVKGMYDHVDVTQVLPENVDPLWYGKTRGNVFQGVMMGSYYDQYRRYCETLTAMDRDIARLLDAMDDMGLTRSSVVIYMGDNGMQWGTHDCHGIREPYEDSIRLPLIVRAPGVVRSPGVRQRKMALNIDISPTLAELAGVPRSHIAGMDGRSLVPLLRNHEEGWRKAWLLEYWRYFPENTPSYRGVRTDRHKYVSFERGRTPWLFDLEKDPGEDRNLYGSREAERILPGLKRALARLAAS